MRSAPFFALFLTFFAASGHAADAIKKQHDMSVILDGQLMKAKAHVIGDSVYVDVRDIGKALNWNVQSSDSTVAIMTSPASAQVGTKISGTITYYFNENYGDKPDTGSRVALLQYDDKFALQLHEADLLQYFESLIKLYKTSKETNSYPIVTSSVVDGSGRYELKDIKPGKYILVIQSSHTSSHAGSVNFLGQIFSMDVEVGKGQSRDVSNNFY